MLQLTGKKAAALLVSLVLVYALVWSLRPKPATLVLDVPLASAEHARSVSPREFLLPGDATCDRPGWGTQWGFRLLVLRPEGLSIEGRAFSSSAPQVDVTEEVETWVERVEAWESSCGQQLGAPSILLAVHPSVESAQLLGVFEFLRSAHLTRVHLLVDDLRPEGNPATSLLPLLDRPDARLQEVVVDGAAAEVVQSDCATVLLKSGTAEHVLKTLDHLAGAGVVAVEVGGSLREPAAGGRPQPTGALASSPGEWALDDELGVFVIDLARLAVSDCSSLDVLGLCLDTPPEPIQGECNCLVNLCRPEGDDLRHVLSSIPPPVKSPPAMDPAPPRRHPWVTVVREGVRVDTDEDAAPFEEVVRRYHSQVSSCAVNTLEGRRSKDVLIDSVVLTLEVYKGRVVSAQSDTSAPPVPCILGKVRRWRFPEGEADLVLSYRFEAGG